MSLSITGLNQNTYLAASNNTSNPSGFYSNIFSASETELLQYIDSYIGTIAEQLGTPTYNTGDANQDSFLKFLDSPVSGFNSSGLSDTDLLQYVDSYSETIAEKLGTPTYNTGDPNQDSFLKFIDSPVSGFNTGDLSYTDLLHYVDSYSETIREQLGTPTYNTGDANQDSFLRFIDSF